MTLVGLSLLLALTLLPGFFLSQAGTPAMAAAASGGGQGGPTTSPIKDDLGPPAVIRFYDGLLQEQPPTLEQERSVFTVSPVMRKEFAEAMGRSREDADKEPVVYEFFRAHRDWFLSRGGLKNRRSIVLSSSAWFYWDLTGLKDKQHSGQSSTERFVIALFIYNPGVQPSVKRTVIFPVADGKILDPEHIRLGGFDAKTVYEHLPVMGRFRAGTADGE